jgi:hypothetical protein
MTTNWLSHTCLALALALPACSPPPDAVQRQPDLPAPQPSGISEDTLHANPSSYAGAHTVVVLRAEHPEAAAHERDTGSHGSDQVRYHLDQAIELEICAEEIAGVDYTLVVRDASERELLSAAST